MRASPKRFALSKKLILTLAFKELKHDWKATGVLLCVIVSIVTPLLIIFGLKQGVINTQRELLLNDPCNLEIKMLGHYHLPQTWFEQKSKDSRIQFVIPITRFLNTDISVIDNENNSRSVDLIPTKQGDPLLKLAAIQAPVQDNEVLITHALAKRLHLNKGDQLKTELFRTIDHQLQNTRASLTVKNIIPDYSCLQRSAVLTTLSFLESVENFKEGQEVNLFTIEERNFPDLKQKNTNDDGISNISFQSFFENLFLLPINIDNNISDAEKEKTALTVKKHKSKKSISPNINKNLQLAHYTKLQKTDFKLNLPKKYGSIINDCNNLTFEKFLENDSFLSVQESNNDSRIDICNNFFLYYFEQLLKNKSLSKNVSDISKQQLARIKTTDQSQTRTNYAKARIFAKTLEDVPVLTDELRSSVEEIEVISKAAEIEKLKQLNHFLNILLLIVSLIGLIGGGLALAGNFLLTIERKRLQIAQLRLLGIGKKYIAFFLWTQGIIITSTAFIVAILLSLATKVISELYSKAILGEVIQITAGEAKIFYLSWHDYLLAYICTLVFSSIVIVIGTKRANSIEAGEQLRES